MAKKSFVEVVNDLLAPFGIAPNTEYSKENMQKIDLTQLRKEAKIIREAYKVTLDAYFNGDKKLFDKASEAWHNLGLVIQVVETLESTVTNASRSIWK